VAEGEQSRTALGLPGKLTDGPHGIAPTGKLLTFRGIQLQRIRNGRIEEEWAGFNTLDALQNRAVPRLGSRQWLLVSGNQVPSTMP